METQKLKIKIGAHEFEAEGPAEVVQAQFDAWRQLVTATPQPPPQAVMPVQPAARFDMAAMQPAGNMAETPLPLLDEIKLDRITRMEGRIVSLTARGASVEDEIMLVLYGQKILRANDSVTGSEVLEGLRQTGRTINRADYQLDKLTDAGDVITIGLGRARRYRLTNQGVTKAKELARGLIATVG